jgi:hypothetical protein
MMNQRVRGILWVVSLLENGFQPFDFLQSYEAEEARENSLRSQRKQPQEPEFLYRSVLKRGQPHFFYTAVPLQWLMSAVRIDKCNTRGGRLDIAAVDT